MNITFSIAIAITIAIVIAIAITIITSCTGCNANHLWAILLSKSSCGTALLLHLLLPSPTSYSPPTLSSPSVLRC